MKEFLSVGQIINTHGLKGEVKVFPLTDDLKRFRKLTHILIDGAERKVVWCKLQTDKVILKIEGIETIEEAVKYKGKYLEVPRENAVKLKKDEYFIADLIGCSIYDQDGKSLGRLDEVISTRSNDVYWIKGENELLIPALKDIVVKIDVENKEIVIKPVETWQ